MKPAKIEVNHLLDKTPRPYTENNKITITIGYYDSLKKNKKKTCRDNISIIDPKTGSNQFDNLREAIVNLNQLIEKKDIKLITSINIVFGPGITWVNPKEKRTYNKQPGDKYFSEPLVLPIGRRKTIIVRLTMGGYGQGVSTIIGSWLGLVYNLQLPSNLEKEEYVACDNLQLTNRLILNNFFWEGPFGLNIIYSNYYNEESRYFRRPILANALDYYNPIKNSFQYSEKWKALTSEKQTEIINRFIQHRKVELIISNLWVEMAQPNPKIIKEKVPLNFTLLLLNLPVHGRIFMVQSNITTYLTPEKEAKSFGVTQISSQFLDPNPPVDVFIQTCSFSTRIFFDVNYICLYLFNLEKVSMLDCQLNGQFSPKCNSLTLFGCYLLSIGPKDPVTNQEYPPNTTNPGITWSPPETPGYPKSSRFIQSNCEYVGMTNRWEDSKGELVEINDYNQVCEFLKKNVNTPNTNNYKITQNVLPWNTSQWKGLTPSVFFSDISFYMVNTDTTIKNPNNHFNLINLTNSLGTCQFGDTTNNTVVFRGTN